MQKLEVISEIHQAWRAHLTLNTQLTAKAFRPTLCSLVVELPPSHPYLFFGGLGDYTPTATTAPRWPPPLGIAFDTHLSGPLLLVSIAYGRNDRGLATIHPHMFRKNGQIHELTIFGQLHAWGAMPIAFCGGPYSTRQPWATCHSRFEKALP